MKIQIKKIFSLFDTFRKKITGTVKKGVAKNTFSKSGDMDKKQSKSPHDILIVLKGEKNNKNRQKMKSVLQFLRKS